MGVFTTVRSYAEAPDEAPPSYTAPADQAPAAEATAPAKGRTAVKPKGGTAAPAKEEPKARTASEVAGDIADYIPAEGIVAYLTAYALISSAKDGNPVIAAWVALGVAVVAVLLFGVFSVLSIRKTQRVNRRKASVGAAIAVALMLLYVSLLPGNGFALIPGWISWIPQIVALLATIALGLWGNRFTVPKGRD